MAFRLAAAALFALSLSPASAPAQQSSPTPVFPGAAPRPVEQQPLPPIAPGPELSRPTSGGPPAVAAPAAPDPGPAGPTIAARAERVFCGQSVALRLAEPRAVGERYRAFLGIWSDASWTPLLCAALIVEGVAPDGTATIVYVFGPMGSPRNAGARGPGGILHGSGVIRDGELRFQNSDGSQFAFRPLYADLAGRLTTPQGQSYEAIFKKTL